jgi:FSR family fosmidomycin resistance protein-like MFS transporter
MISENSPTPFDSARTTVFSVILTLTFAHFLNDVFQSLITASYPLIKESLALTFTQIGLITMTFQFTSSVCQPVVGWFTDKRPMPYLMPIGMTSTLIGILLMANAGNFFAVLISVALIGLGSAVFHPEGSRIVFLASGHWVGAAQSFFLVGGNIGASFGPLLAALLLVPPYGQKNTAWFAVFVFVTVILLLPISRWYSLRLKKRQQKTKTNNPRKEEQNLPRKTIVVAISVLLMLIFSKYVYLACFRSFYTFYLIGKFNVSVQTSQVCLFTFLFAAATGTLIGGPVGDRIGRKHVIWFSILGIAPFSFWLPYAGSLWETCVLSVVIGLILSSAFSAILVYAQELLPGNVGTIAGLFFGLAFGIAGIASAILGKAADDFGIEFVFQLCAFLPLLGLTACLLPNMKPQKE